MYYVYVFHSLKDNKFYIGYTTNLEKRTLSHIKGEVKATKNRQPLKLIYYEAYSDKRDAKGREKFLKGGSGHKYLKKQLKHYLDEYF